MNRIPSLTELGQYDVNRMGQQEGIKATLYDQQTYPAAGTTQLQFFQTPKGQSGKTFADTNMTLAGSLPKPQRFLITGVELYFFPMSSVPQQYKGNSASATIPAASAAINDNYIFWKSASFLDLFIGSKSYLTEAPLMKFPPSAGLGGFGALADTTTAGAAQLNQIGYASASGDPYEVNPPLLLIDSQNFNVTLNWNALEPISANAKVFCQLNGFLYRLSQ